MHKDYELVSKVAMDFFNFEISAVDDSYSLTWASSSCVFLHSAESSSWISFVAIHI
jgi:hypothetical protein